MKKVTRENRREKEREINFFEEFIKLQKHFFKDINNRFKRVKDPRHKSYIRELSKSIKEISSSLLESFRTRLLTEAEDILHQENRTQIRFL